MMLDLWTFALLLEDIAPSFEVIEGRIFLDREKAGREGLINMMGSYKDIGEAQYWINMVPIDDLLKGSCGKLSMDDPALEKILNIYRRSWTSIIVTECGVTSGFSVEMLKDTESGDIAVSLKQE